MGEVRIASLAVGRYGFVGWRMVVGLGEGIEDKGWIVMVRW